MSGFTWVDKFDELGDNDTFDLFGVFSNKLGTSFTENVEGTSLGVPGWLRHVFEMDDTASKSGGLDRCVSAPSPVVSFGVGDLDSCGSAPSPWVVWHFFTFF